MFKKTWIGLLFTEFFHSFDNKDGVGFDERKMSGFGVIVTAILIGMLYAYDMYKCANPLTWEGVMLVGVYLTFGALYLMILNPKQIERILSIIYNKQQTTITESESNIVQKDTTTVVEKPAPTQDQEGMMNQ